MLIRATYYLLDVFTEYKYGGNPLAIFPDARGIDEARLQKIAREMNLSETVFLFPPENKGDFMMRIFTPFSELPTAGHPTIGTAFYLAREFDHPEDGQIEITLDQHIGPIDVTVEFKKNTPHLITMQQPLPVFGPTHEDKREALASCLSLEVADLDPHPIQEISCGNNTLIIPVTSTEALKRIGLRADQWEALKPLVGNALLYIFTTKGMVDGDVQGRMFAPELGIMEDPATGSANGPLACYLTQHQILKLPAISLQGIEMGRPSKLFLDTQVDSKGDIQAVKVGGKCVFVGEGVHFLD